ncbi:MAG: hypothetical protein ABL984_18905 [Pyrinomonadaceae bacterium]
MNNDAIVVLHGFFQLPHLEKKKVVDGINDYFDSMDREPIRAEYDRAFAQLKSDEPSFHCKCCERS